MYGTITRVAAGCPTTFCDKIAVRFSAGSTGCFLGRVAGCGFLVRSTIRLLLLYRADGLEPLSKSSNEGICETQLISVFLRRMNGLRRQSGRWHAHHRKDCERAHAAHTLPDRPAIGAPR